MHFHGEAALEDREKGAALIRQAAEEGLAIAQGQIGVLYAAGEELPSDGELARHWFRLGAHQDDPWSLFYLGTRVMEDGDRLGARRLLRSAAEAGLAEAQFAYSQFLIDPEQEKWLPDAEIRIDAERGMEYIGRAASQGFPHALFTQGFLSVGLIRDSTLTSEERELLQATAFASLHSAIDRGDALGAEVLNAAKKEYASLLAARGESPVS